MSYKWMRTSFPYLYKFKINSKIDGDGSINIYDNLGNLLYSDIKNTRGHTLYVFNESLQLISKTNYDSYAEGNTDGITNEINKYIERIGYMFAIVTCDSITHDSKFNDLMRLSDGKSFDLGKDVSCYQSRNSFAFLGVNAHSQNMNVGYEHDCNFDYNVNKDSTLISYIIKSKIHKSYKPIVLTRHPEMYTRIYPSNDTTQPIGIPYLTHNVGNFDRIVTLKNPKLYAGRTYYVKVRFRTRGDGSSTASKCSSVGFITFWNNWLSTIGYIHRSDTAYKERGQVVEWTYSFTVNEDVQPIGSDIYFIVNNAWADGNDGQTIDLYYVKYWDSLGNVYSKLGKDTPFLKLKKDNLTYYAPNLRKHDSNIVFDAYGKIFFGKPNSYEIYALRDTLEKYTYSELEHLKFSTETYKIINLDYMQLMNY